MKIPNKKISPFSLALVGGLVLTPNAQAVNSPTCDITTTSDTTRYLCHVGDTDTGDYSLNKGITLDTANTIVDIDDPNLEIKKDLSKRHLYGVLGFHYVKDASIDPTPSYVETNIKNFKSIDTREYSETEAIIFITQGKDRTSSYINSKTTITGDGTRYIKATTDNSGKTASQLETAITNAFADTYWAAGKHEVKIDAPNTTYIARAENEQKQYWLDGIREEFQHGDSQLDFEFASGHIDVDGQGRSQTAMGIFAHNADSGKIKNLYGLSNIDNYFNLKIRGGNIVAKNANYVYGLYASHTNSDSDIKNNIALFGKSDITLSGGRIEVSGGKYEVIGIISNPDRDERKALGDIETTSITQTGGDIIVDGASIDLTHEETWIGGLVLYAKEQDYKAVVKQLGGNITITNAKADSPNGDHAATAIYTSSNQDVEITQGSPARATITGNNSTFITADSASNNIKIDVEGYGKAEGYGIVAKTKAGKKSDINLLGNATIIADKALYNNEGNSTTTIDRDVTLAGSTTASNGLTAFDLGEGDDKVIFNGTNLDKVGTLDGGQDADVTTDFDTIVFNDYNNLDLGNRLQNWERVELNNGVYQLSQDLTIGHGKRTDGSISGLILNNSTLNVDKADAVLTGDLRNLGTLNLGSKTAGDFQTLTVNGDYYTGGLLTLNAALNDDNSSADKLAITGNVKGTNTTKVKITNQGGLGGETTDGIRIIELADTSNVEAGDKAFKLDGSVEAGAYEYNTLAYNQVAGKKGFYLQSKAKAITKPNVRGDVEAIDTRLFRQDVVGYLLNQQINTNALHGLVTNLHQRVGEQRAETNFLNPSQSWVRSFTNQNSLEARNLKADSGEYALQVGWDFDTKANNQGLIRTGVYGAYSKVESKLADTYRGEDKIPGRVDSDLASLGLYNTLYLGNNYLDLVGSFHFIHTDYEIKHGGAQNGFGGSLSLEAGSNLDLGNNFFVEPQVQLSYQGTHYSAFKDTVSDVKAYNSQSLRPRLGLRLGYHDVKGTNLWVHANLEFELLKTAKLQIGNTLVATDRAAKKVYDLGLNGQVALSPTTVLYGSAQYKASLGKDKASKFHGYGAEVGLRFTW